jgi:predicted XRE-type DNA-binding protein
MMDPKKRKRLEAAGFRFEDAEDFLGLTDAERQLVELRLAVSRAVRRRREEQRLTQKELATKLKTSQPRVVRIESGAADVSLDLIFRGLFAVGGTVRDVLPERPRPAVKSRGRSPRPIKAAERGKPDKTAGEPVGR